MRLYSKLVIMCIFALVFLSCNDNVLESKSGGSTSKLVRNELVIKNTVTEIKKGVHENKGYTAVVIPRSVKKIERQAFKGNPITEVTLPESLLRSVLFGRLNGRQDMTVLFSTYSGKKQLSIGFLVTAIPSNKYKGRGITKIIGTGQIVEYGENSFADNKISEISLGGNRRVKVGKSAFANNSISSISIRDVHDSKNLVIEENAFDGNNVQRVRWNREFYEKITQSGKGGQSETDIKKRIDDYLNFVSSSATKHQLDDGGYITFSKSGNSIKIKFTVNGGLRASSPSYYSNYYFSSLDFSEITSARRLSVNQSIFSNNKLEMLDLRNVIDLNLRDASNAFVNNRLREVILPVTMTDSNKLPVRGFHNNPLTKVTLHPTLFNAIKTSLATYFPATRVKYYDINNTTTELSP